LSPGSLRAVARRHDATSHATRVIPFNIDCLLIYLINCWLLFDLIPNIRIILKCILLYNRIIQSKWLL
jgi:hypothetical protein